MLLDSDTQLNQNSYYEASVQRRRIGAAVAGRRDGRRAGGGRGLRRAVGGLELAQRGYQVVVLEADRIGSGASGRNGGQAIVGYASGQGPFEQQLGAADARLAWDMSVQAVDLIESASNRLRAFDCDWRQRLSLRGRLADARRARWTQSATTMERDYGFATRVGRGRRCAAPHSQPALRGRVHENHLGPPAPAEVRAGAGAARHRRWGCAFSRTRR